MAKIRPTPAFSRKEGWPWVTWCRAWKVSIGGMGFSMSLVCKILISKQFQNKWRERLATCSIYGQPPSPALLPHTPACHTYFHKPLSGPLQAYERATERLIKNPMHSLTKHVLKHGTCSVWSPPPQHALSSQKYFSLQCPRRLPTQFLSFLSPSFSPCLFYLRVYIAKINEQIWHNYC